MDKHKVIDGIAHKMTKEASQESLEQAAYQTFYRDLQSLDETTIINVVIQFHPELIKLLPKESA